MTWGRISRALVLLFSVAVLAGCSSFPVAPYAPVPAAPPGPVAANADRDDADPVEVTLPPLAVIDFDPKRRAVDKPSAQTPPTDLWDRMRRGFSLSVPDNPRVRRELKWYLAHPEHLAAIEERARPYLFHILEEVERRDLPRELALLPAVESSFQPFAYSAERASGIWQFIPSTGRMYGLKQSWWYDGRRDIVASTRAALDHLEKLNQRFRGNWALALAAYNSGGGTVSRALRKNRSKGRPTDYWSLKLPRETSAYVPRLLALARLVATPDAFGLALNDISNRPYFTQVDIGGQLDLGLAAEMAGITIDELYSLNPGFNRWATDPDGPHRLYLPRARAAEFRHKLASLSQDERLRWRRYQIQSGDTLSEIAADNGISVEHLKRANQLSRDRIVAGNHLLIPSPHEAASHLAFEDPGARVSTSTPRTYRVQPGDSLWRIGRRFRVNHRQLARWNGIAVDELLHPGQDLLVRAPETPGKRADTEPDPVQYRVRRGDSLSTIAHQFKVSVSDLQRWNQLPDTLLKPGQELMVYLDTKS